MMAAAVSDRINFRVSRQLRKKLKEAASKSGVTLSEQARRTLEKVYGVEQADIWLPPLGGSFEGASPTSVPPATEKP
jgi:hypothetical protein